MTDINGGYSTGMKARVFAALAQVQGNDTVQRAEHTFWQAAVASLMASYAASGADLSQMTDVSTVQRIAGSAVVAGLAASLSVLKGAVTSKSN